MSSWGARLALLAAALSVWVGFEIGFDDGRRLLASVFFFGIPGVIAALSIWVRKKSRQVTSVLDPARAELTCQIEQVSTRLLQVERKLDEVLQLLTTSAVMPRAGVEKHDQP
jgi:hypothetical protein